MTTRAQSISIDDPADPRVAPYHSIRERDLAGRHGRFIAEGKVVLNVLFSSSSFAPESVLVLHNRLPGIAALLERAPAEMPIYVASQPVMDAIAGFHIHRGILAIGLKQPTLSAQSLAARLPETSLVLILVGLANHDNVGAIFRNAAAFGVDAVFLDNACCDPLYRKAIRVSVGAVLKVPFAATGNAGDLADMLDGLGFEQVALSPSGATDIRTLKRPKRLALFLGTEGEGLPDTLLSRLKTARIAMSEDFDSLNVAAASAIALHHFSQV